MSGASNVQKTPLPSAVTAASQQRVLSVIQQLGKSLPCSVVATSESIVTVKFEIRSIYNLPTVTIPVAAPEWIRYPVQVGDTGVTVAADAYLGGVSGLGGGIADLTPPANLTALFFVPLGSTKFTPSEDTNAMVIYGPDGTIIRNVAKTFSVSVGVGGKNEVKGVTTFDALVTMVADALINNIQWSSHVHPDPQGGFTGPPQNP